MVELYCQCLNTKTSTQSNRGYTTETVKIIDSGLHFYFLFSLYFIFIFRLFFLFLEQLGLGFVCYAVTSVTSWWHSHKT